MRRREENIRNQTGFFYGLFKFYAPEKNSYLIANSIPLVIANVA